MNGSRGRVVGFKVWRLEFGELKSQREAAKQERASVKGAAKLDLI